MSAVKKPEVAVVIAAAAPPPPTEWNGELDGLRKQPWWAHLPPEHATAVEAGLRQKHGAWQAGYQKRFGELDHAKRLADARAMAQHGDRIADLERQLAAEKASHDETRRAANLYTQWFADDGNADKISALEKEKEELAAKFADLQAKHDEHLAYRQGREAQDAEAVKADAEAEANSFVEANKDLLDDPDACELLHHLLETTDVDPHDVAAKVRALKMKHAPEPEVAPIVTPVEPPPLPKRPDLDPLDVMHQGDSAPGLTQAAPMSKRGVSSQDIWDAAERAARLHGSNARRM